MADRNVSMIAQVGGTVSNQYLRTIETVEQRQERLTGALKGTQKQLGVVAAAQDYERRLQNLRRRQRIVRGSVARDSAGQRPIRARAPRRAARMLGADCGEPSTSPPGTGLKPTS